MTRGTRLTQEPHRSLHAGRVPEVCLCWADCPCRNTTCRPDRPLSPILDMKGVEIRKGDLLKQIPIDGHKCEGVHCYRGNYAFYCRATEKPPSTNGGFSDVQRGDFYALAVGKDGVPLEESYLIHRFKEKTTYYRRHDYKIVGRARDPEEEGREAGRSRVQALFAKASEGVLEKYRALHPDDFKKDGSPEKSFGEDLQIDELKFELKALRYPFLLQELSSGEGEVLDFVGMHDEGKAIDYFLEEPSKYGRWTLSRWDAGKKRWLEASVKRRGKRLELVWKPLTT